MHIALSGPSRALQPPSLLPKPTQLLAVTTQAIFPESLRNLHGQPNSPAWPSATPIRRLIGVVRQIGDAVILFLCRKLQSTAIITNWANQTLINRISMEQFCKSSHCISLERVSGSTRISVTTRSQLNLSLDTRDYYPTSSDPIVPVT